MDAFGLALAQSVRIFGRVLQHVSQGCDVVCINYYRALGSSAGIEFQDPTTDECLGGLVSVRPLSAPQSAVEVSVGIKSFIVSSVEETDRLNVFQDRHEFAQCFRASQPGNRRLGSSDRAA